MIITYLALSPPLSPLPLLHYVMFYLFKGYHDVITLPAGAGNIEIDTDKQSHNVIGEHWLLDYSDNDILLQLLILQNLN